jgi:hypothetical protein
MVSGKVEQNKGFQKIKVDVFYIIQNHRFTEIMLV